MEADHPKRRIQGHKQQSLEKKRARDRRAQQTLRAKRISHVKSLENHISSLTAELQRLHQTCETLHRKNVALQCGSTQTITPRTIEEDGVISCMPRAPDTANAPLDTTSRRGHTTKITSAVVGTISELNRNELCEMPQTIEPRIWPWVTLSDPCPPPWNVTPAHSDLDGMVTDSFNLCLNRPDLVYTSPDSPSPLELLYGSKKNFLANVISESIRRWPCRDPERLAGGWLSYHFIKWMLRPTEKRFSHLVEFQRPIQEQLAHPHPYFVDFLPWARLRANLIRSRHDYDAREVLGLLTCCVKLRWPWGENCLEPDENGRWVMRTKFLDTFTRVEGWALTDDFAKRFPRLVEGLDMDAIGYQFTEAR